HLRSPVCIKYNEKFSANIGILTLKYHMEKKHNIKIPQVITNQTKLSFSHIDLWLAKEKQECDNALATLKLCMSWLKPV
ncbi:1962_t:CDS:1, partial [Funneliformis geosporum]